MKVCDIARSLFTWLSDRSFPITWSRRAERLFSCDVSFHIQFNTGRNPNTDDDEQHAEQKKRPYSIHV